MASYKEQHVSHSTGRAGGVALLVVVQLLLVLDTTIVTSAVPTMSARFHASVTLVSLAQSVYALLFGALLLVGGALADRFGPRRTLRWALAGFALAGFVVVLPKTSISTVIAIRAAQGASAALAAPASLSMLLSLPSHKARQKGLGWFASVGAIGLALGVGLGTPTIALAGWRAAFLGPAVIAAFLFIATASIWERAPESTRPLSQPLLRLTGLMTLALAAVEAALLAPWWVALVALVVAAPLLAWALWRDRRSASPTIPPAMFTDGRTRTGLVLMAAFGGWQAAEVLLLSVLLAPTTSHHPWLAGLPFWIQGTVALLLSPKVQRWCESETRIRHIMVTSPCLAGLGFLAVTLLSATHGDTALLLTATSMVTIAFGVAAVAASTAATLASVTRTGRSGQVGAIMTAARQLGTSIATCVIGAFLALPALGTPGTSTIAGAITILVGIVLIPLLRRRRPGPNAA